MSLLTYRLLKAKVLNRPSKVNKSPYLLDIELENNPGISVVAHNASLSCGGYVKADAEVYVYENKGSDTISKYTVFLVKDSRYKGTLDKCETFVCTQSILANKIGKILLENYFKFESLKAEYKLEKNKILPEPKGVSEGFPENKILPDETCRFDFYGINPNTKKETLIEIKSVPLADYVDCINKEYKKKMESLPRDESGKISSPFQAIFPYGEKRKLELVSERALKHTNSLKILSQEPYNYDCIMLYIVLRPDVSCLKISELDVEYRSAVLEAMKYYNFYAYSLDFKLKKEVPYKGNLSEESLSEDSKDSFYTCNIELHRQLAII